MTLTEAQYRNNIVRTGIAQVGRPYRDSADPTNWPPQQFDCSTFAHWLEAMNGVNIDTGAVDMKPWPPREPVPWHKYPGYTMTQQSVARSKAGSIVSFSSIKPGDRLYYDKPGSHHVVIYIGGGKVVHASSPSTGVIISPVVTPGNIGFAGKKLTMCVSATRFARACGYRFASSPAPVPTPTPVKLPTVFLAHILSAIRKDGPAVQGHTTYKSEVLLVENALVREGLLASNLADGSAGTASFGNGSAYQKYQERLGYSGSGADGIPGKQSLTTMGRKYRFNVI